MRSTPQPRFYRGVLISPFGPTLAGVRWSAHVGGRFVYADTLDGIKRMVRERIAGGAR